MRLVWKLLRRHLSLPQFAGFFLANFIGMTIILLAFQFYSDVMPVFTSPDSFMKAGYKVIAKSENMGGTLSGRTAQFYDSEIEDLQNQDFVKKTSGFTPALYKVMAAIGVSGSRLLSTEIYFESIPDEYVDIPADKWKWSEGDNTVPIVLPRSYINMYNFGFARSRSLPHISDGLVGMIDVSLTFIGKDATGEMKGRVVGFSNSLSSILVPESFMTWSNGKYAKGESASPSRLIVECRQGSEGALEEYLEEAGMETENGDAKNGKAASFLRLMVTLVTAFGIIISLLSLYILLLSIYLLVQKNVVKMQNLLLIGYSPLQVAQPYQLLSVGLLSVVVLLSAVVVAIARSCYLPLISYVGTEVEPGSMLPTLVAGLLLAAVSACVNAFVVYRRVLKCLKPMSV